MTLSLVHSTSRVALAIAAALVLPHGAALAADGPNSEERAAGLEQVIVTGTRRAERTVLESNVPIDVVSNDDLRRTAQPDLNSKLQAAIPSYNVRRLPTSDGSIFVRPASLRNLSPDHTLVMINGKRFHRSAFVDVTARGAQAVNLALLPANAFKRTEVLRDGAAAQYGSDAIAGVINFIPNDEPGTDTYVQFGEYNGGDGQNLQVGWSSGFQFGESGHLNFAAEYIDADATNNGIQRPQAALIAAQGEPYASAVRNLGEVVQRYGLPEQETKKLFINAGFNLTENTQLYTFGSFADDTGVADFNYRPSLTVTGPNADGNIVTFARNGGYNIKSNGKHSIYQTAGTDGVNTWAATDPDFNLLNIYPGGFTPRFGSDTRDYSLVAGVKGTLGSNLDWDLSASTGSNRIEYWLKESINLSLGSLSPTEFDNGGREQREQDVNLDFVYQWQTALANPINVGFGLEYRREEFRITAGEYASWAVGPLRDLSPASNGFPGAHPATAGAWDSYNTAAYVDFDVNLTDRLNVGVAGRFEDYSLFGTTTNGKLAARFELTKAVSLRGAVSTGFRAPTPGQQYLQNIGQNPNVNPLSGRSVDVRAQLPSNSEAAALFGGKALTPEESLNLSFGVVVRPFDGASVTLDAYQIDVDDRIGLSTAFELTAAQRQQLVAQNVPLANELTHVSFYTNSFDTRTRGLDLVANWQGSVGPGALGITWASNYNHTEYRRFDPVLIDEQARTTFLKTIPRFTTHLSTDYSFGKWQVTARGRHFGEWTYVASTTLPYVYEQIGSETFLDLIGAYQFSDSVNITVGVENVLDNYIQEVGLVTVRNNGRRYPGGAPYENEGRQVYARVGVRF